MLRKFFSWVLLGVAGIIVLGVMFLSMGLTILSTMMSFLGPVGFFILGIVCLYFIIKVTVRLD